MKHFLLFIIAFLFVCTSFAQKDQEKMYTKAEDYTATAKFEEALKLYKKLLEVNKENHNYNFKVGFSYYMIPDKKDNAITFFEKASENISATFTNKYDDSAAPVETWLYIADIYHKNYMFDEAIKAYDTLKTYLKDENKIDELNRNIQSCKIGSELIFKTIDVSVVRLGSSINSKFDEHSPVLTADLKKLIFTSKRKGTGGMKDDDGNYFEDIYISEYINNIWSSPKSISDNINTDKHEASVGLSVDGKTLYIYRGSRGGDLYYSIFKNNEWSKPKTLGKTINTKYKEAHASVSADGNTLYFSSNKPGGLGGMDIYISKRINNGNWGKPVNIGAPINTKFDDEGPYINPDDSTLYFSSKGHKGMGGFDLFSTSKKSDGTWSEPQNLGYPVNSTNDDIFYTGSPGGSYGFYVSNQMGFSGSRDISMVVNPQQKKKKVGVIKGNVYVKNLQGIENKDSLIVEINIIDPYLKDTIRTYFTDPTDGDYTLVVPTEKNYIISYNAPNQFSHLEYIVLSGKSDLLTGKNSHVLDTVVLNSKQKKYKIKFKKNADSFDYLSKLYLDEISNAINSNNNYGVEFSTPGFEPLLNARKNQIFKYLENNNLDTTIIRNTKNKEQLYEILLADSIFFSGRLQERIITFKPGSAEIEFTSKRKLEEIKAFLDKSSELELEIPFNINDSTTLNRERLSYIYKYYKKNGIDSSRLYLKPIEGSLDFANNTKIKLKVKNKELNEQLILLHKYLSDGLNDFATINFAQNTTVLDLISKLKLNKLAYYLRKGDINKIEIPSYESYSTDKVNGRINAIKNFIIAQGVGTGSFNIAQLYGAVEDEDAYQLVPKSIKIRSKEVNITFKEKDIAILDSSKVELDKIVDFIKKDKSVILNLPLNVNDSSELSYDRLQNIYDYFSDSVIDDSRIFINPTNQDSDNNDKITLNAKPKKEQGSNVIIASDYFGNETEDFTTIIFKNEKTILGLKSKLKLNKLSFLIKKKVLPGIEIPLYDYEKLDLSKSRTKSMREFLFSMGVDTANTNLKKATGGVDDENVYNLSVKKAKSEKSERKLVFKDSESVIENYSKRDLDELLYLMKSYSDLKVDIPLNIDDSTEVARERLKYLYNYFRRNGIDDSRIYVKPVEAEDAVMNSLKVELVPQGEHKEELINVSDFMNSDIDNYSTIIFPNTVSDLDLMSKLKLNKLSLYVKKGAIDKIDIPFYYGKNKKLSRSRVNNIKDYFKSMNIDSLKYVVIARTVKSDKENIFPLELHKGEITTDEVIVDETNTDEVTTDETTTDEVATDETHTDEVTTDENNENVATTDENGTEEVNTDEIATDENTTDEVHTDENVNTGLDTIVDKSVKHEKNIVFKESESDIEENSKKDLEDLLALLDKHPDLKVDIPLIVDDSTKLSRNRLKYLYDYFTENGINDSRIFIKPIDSENAVLNNVKVELVPENEHDEELILTSDFFNSNTDNYNTIIFPDAVSDLDLKSKLKLNKLSHLIKTGAITKADIPFYYGKNTKLSRSRVNSIKDYFKSMNTDTLKYVVIARTVNTDNENIYPFELHEGEIVVDEVVINEVIPDKDKSGEKLIVFQNELAVPEQFSMTELDTLLSILDGEENFITEIPFNVDDNTNLSEKRIQYIYDYFANNGVGDDQIYIYPIGKETSKDNKINVRINSKSDKLNESILYSDYYGESLNRFSSIIFDESEVNLNVNNKFKLNKLSKYLNGQKDTLVEIPLHTNDETGLSKKRVNSILEYFELHGVDSFQHAVKLNEVGFGNDYKLNFFNANNYKTEDNVVSTDKTGCEFLSSNTTFATVYFGFDKYRTSKTEGLDEIVNCLINNPDTKVEVGGHTDAIGPNDYNFILGRRRAGFVKKYLINKGVKENQLVSRSFSEDSPIAENTVNGKDNPSGRKLNRRVELKILNPS